ncbi:glycoside hydrolase family 61 protein [Marasmius fiardii PR-910]|nr:glycoside hydrolase family 61 protein [Marasmius fiardii PR-910]
MKFAAALLSTALLVQSASAHFLPTDIWTTLIAGSTTSTAAVRQPLSNSPVQDVTSKDITCNVTPHPATETVSVAAGSTIGFKLDNTLYHQGPAAIYLGKVPSGGTAASWDGSGGNWFKIAEWGATFNPFTFTDFNAAQLTTTIPSTVPAGEYLVRIEQIGLHVAGAPQWYISCAQIKITGGGSANPSKVSIPGYVSPSDPGLTVNIYYPIPTSYTVPGPRPFRG